MITYDYKINNNTITCVISCRNLGIVFKYSMSFSLHINNIIKKAFKMLGFIKRNWSNFKNINALKTLFFSLVRSHLEVWFDCLVTELFFI